MRKGNFIINNVYSEDINSLIQERPRIPTPKRKVTLRDVPGRSGYIPFDEEAYENAETNLLLFTKGESEGEIRGLKDEITYLFDSGNYLDFIYYADPEKIYRIKTLSLEFQDDGRYPLILPYTLNVSIKPFKYLLSEQPIEITEDITLHNPSSYNSEPEITIYGKGNINLIINDKEYVFKNVDDYITVDSEFKNAHKDYQNRNDRMYTIDFPILEKINEISWMGDVEKLSIKPRWRWLV